MFEREAVRGHFVRMGEVWRSLREHRDYPTAVRELLGEAASASVLFASTLKFRGTLTLQLAGEGAVRLLVAQCTHDFRVRALARFDAGRLGGAQGTESRLAALEPSGTSETLVATDAPEAIGAPDTSEVGMFRHLVGESGRLVVTVEAADRGTRYQGIVPLVGRSLSESLEEYFASSEQLPTRVRLAADEHHAAGLLVQRLPGGSDSASRDAQAEPGSRDAQAESAWRDAQRGVGEVGRDELLSQPLERVLTRHFPGRDVRVFAGSAVQFECRCNPGRVARLLRALGADEVRDVLAEQGSVTVTCDFCDKPYRFDAIDIEQLLAAGATAQVPPSVQ